MNKKRNHDSLVKTIFENPKNMAELLQIAAKKNESIQSFLDVVDLSTLRTIPTEAPRDGLAGAADLAFQMNLNNSTQHAGLLVGMVLEHKSWKDTHVIEQLYHYYFEVIRQKIDPSVPTVAIILYNGKEDWDPTDFRLYPDYPDYFKGIGVPFKLEFIDVGEHIDFSDLEDYDPQVLLTLVALCYAQDPEHHKELFQKVLERMKTMEYSEVIDTINAILIYLREALSKEEKEHFMDTLEAFKNKGYISIAEDEEMQLKELREGLDAAEKGLEVANMRIAEERMRADEYLKILKANGLA